MKKSILLFAGVFALSMTGISQEETFKPVAGMSSLEVTFDPSAIFNASSPGSTFALPSINNMNNGIKYRMWLGDKVAARGTFLLGLQNTTVATQLINSGGEIVDAKDTYFEWAVQFRPGTEFHFEGTKRLSPYIGGELILAFGSNKYTTESLDISDAIVESYVKNGSSDFNGGGLPWMYLNGFSVGIGGLAGFDYYVAKDLYLGLEINYAFVYNKPFNVESQVAGSDAVTTKTGNNWYLNPSAGANLRLGWNF